MKRNRFWAAILIVLFSFSANAAKQEVRLVGGDGIRMQNSGPCLTESQRQEIRARLDLSEKSLVRRGLLPSAGQSHPLFNWPLKQKEGLHDIGFWGISNFIDENPAFPNQVQDYNGGTRSYDTAAGYNHQGTDIYGWPFDWAKYYLGEIRILAAAPGVILQKDDGHFDRNCSFAPQDQNWNAVYVRNDDGSQTWYGHLKRGSQTTKPVGSRVQAGEFIGLMGSSGISTAPHLHFEVYDSAQKLIDPWQGPTNHHNTDTWWLAQRPYRDSSINRLQTHKAPPKFSECGKIESIAASDDFKPGQTMLVAAYYRDQQPEQLTNYSLVSPTGKIAAQWTHSSPQTYSSSYWYWSFVIPANAELGPWKFKATFQGKTATHAFRVAKTLPQFQITSIAPASIKAGTNATLQISGTGFVKGLAASIANPNASDDRSISVVSVEVKSDTLAVLKVSVTGTGTVGPRTVNLIRPDYTQVSKRAGIQVLR